MNHLQNHITTLNHSKESRANFAAMIHRNPKLLNDLLDTCMLTKEDISFRACWGLEFVAKENINLLLPHLDKILHVASITKKHQAVRPMAKICEYIILNYYVEKNTPVINQVSIAHLERIAEQCFDWLITDQKVAAKAYSMTCLYHIGNKFDWIHPELKLVLQQNYGSGSAAYKARARMVLKKLK